MEQPSIKGDVRDGDDFRFVAKASRVASSTFTALVSGQLVVTRRASDLFGLPDDTPVLAHWHGQWRTDGFAMTVGLLKAKAREFDPSTPA